jgi:hypothetical protein
MSLDTALPHGKTLIAKGGVVPCIRRRYALLHGITRTRRCRELACSREMITAEYVARIAGGWSVERHLRSSSHSLGQPMRAEEP